MIAILRAMPTTRERKRWIAISSRLPDSWRQQSLRLSSLHLRQLLHLLQHQHMHQLQRLSQALRKSRSPRFVPTTERSDDQRAINIDLTKDVKPSRKKIKKEFVDLTDEAPVDPPSPHGRDNPISLD